MSLPNSLTLLRIFFVPLLVALLLTKGPNMDLWAVVVFIVAALTDLLDGYLARRNSQVSRLGILLDPIADKLLTSAAFISL
ncbi:MAG: CDP-alcohol phosphatidyltransferase family protein, partial [Terriglobia bacterium]